MASSRVAVIGTKQVKPILSANKTEAKRRVLNLYKAWYRHLPYLVKDYNIAVTVPETKAKLRELFLKNKHVSDIRAIDLLVIKGQMDLVETMRIWKQKTHVMMFFKDTNIKKPTAFLSRFYEGHD
ncbi:hypothetical protein CHS0354_004431 [Potamilus streckersoni]|uniref:NADH dehydrogenase [ubiquinone] 1 alpha subcomplex subunit 6 n=1 Tax=Potamilus streckersoni TaxID=2493646 RepID=A0AAE0W9L3_9BIVA|nr:hypothetical protein CHS0354_004431 [Potamilus streckersoni]